MSPAHLLLLYSNALDVQHFGTADLNLLGLVGISLLGQARQWKDHHRKICKTYNRYVAYEGFQTLSATQRVDAIMLSQLVPLIFPDDKFMLPLEKPTPPISTFLDLLPGSPLAVPPTCGSTKSTAPIDILNTLFSRFGNNNFLLHSHLTSYAHGIYPQASRLFNHSCYPNCATRYVIKRGEHVTMEIIALRDVAEGDEMTIPYVDPALPYDTRQDALRGNYGFTCTCSLCTTQKEIGVVPSPPEDPDELSRLERGLCEYTWPAKEPVVVPATPTPELLIKMPTSLRPVLHPDYLPELSERFSKASHEGQYEVALPSGRTLLALYMVLYPPNYPQIGIHALELAKTAWNAVVTREDPSLGNRVLPPGDIEKDARSYLNVAREILEVFGPEGDEGGPLEEIRVLNRHSFLSTTGLLRSPSSGSIMSVTSTYSQTPLASSSRGTTTTPLSTSQYSKVSGPSRTRVLRGHRTTLPEPLQPAVQTMHEFKRRSVAPRLRTRAGIVPLGPTFLVVMAVLFSLFFVGTISFAFIGSEEETPPFKTMLDAVARDTPGIVLVGDNVDVDIDEPSITVRWTIVGCGVDYVLPGSEGSHGSDGCGLPPMPLDIYADSELSASYDPANFPIVSSTGKRQSIQNLFQFDSDHVLDVHEARLYPFDTYHLTSTLRVVSRITNTTLPLQGTPTLTQTSSFIISPSDVAASLNISLMEPAASARELELTVKRPAEARMFALLLFAVNWMMAHATVAYVVLGWKSGASAEKMLKYLAFVVGTLLVIPQLRNAMPDAPGFDGVLIDSIGFFPQMIMSGLSLIAILATVARKELAVMSEDDTTLEEAPHKGPQEPLSSGLRRLRLAGSSSSIDFGNRHGAFSRNFHPPPSPIAE
ncbi:hypothetical protein EIP91_004608 [Steccherinum ochraceum]|uniref:SET domain-containing protein n=1 Tax=Steccherinum ochraceum TaxID=92696 RepID=A0A4R0RZT8_9APHY|nr:hypothetical protein EIP91_004608 [Steccherinum ochraceum]